MYRRAGAGFTLVELMLVIGIIGILMAIVLMSLSSARQKARDAERLSDLKTIATALEFYYLKSGHYPVATGWINGCTNPGGNWISDNGDFSWNVPYLPTVPHDPLENCSDPSPHTYSYKSDGNTYQITTQLEGKSAPNGSGGSSGNFAFNGSQFEQVTDTSPITVTFSSSARSPTNQSPIPVTITFSRAVTDFTQGILGVLRGFVSGFSQTLTTVYNVFVTPTDNDVVVLTLNGGAVHDASGVGNAAAQFTITYDSLRPHVALSPDPLQSTVSGPFAVTANFTVPVTNFSAASVTLQNGSAQSVQETSPMNGTNYIFTVIPNVPGPVSLMIKDGAVQSSAGNTNVVSNTLSTTYAP